MNNDWIGDRAGMSILRFLLRSRGEWSGREVARHVGLSAPACHEALKRLEARGLVLFRRVSNAHLYKINADSYMVDKALRPMFEAEAGMAREVETEIRRAFAASRDGRTLSLVLFGSFARAVKSRPARDLDLLIVLRSQKDLDLLEPGIERLRDTLFRRFHLPLSAHVQTVAELREKGRRGLPLIAEIQKDGRTLMGRAIQELLK